MGTVRCNYSTSILVMKQPSPVTQAFIFIASWSLFWIFVIPILTLSIFFVSKIGDANVPYFDIVKSALPHAKGFLSSIIKESILGAFLIYLSSTLFKGSTNRKRFFLCISWGAFWNVCHIIHIITIPSTSGMGDSLQSFLMLIIIGFSIVYLGVPAAAIAFFASYIPALQPITGLSNRKG
jgi:hypothetical protein